MLQAVTHARLSKIVIGQYQPGWHCLRWYVIL